MLFKTSARTKDQSSVSADDSARVLDRPTVLLTAELFDRAKSFETFEEFYRALQEEPAVSSRSSASSASSPDLFFSVPGRSPRSSGVPGVVGGGGTTSADGVSCANTGDVLLRLDDDARQKLSILEQAQSRLATTPHHQIQQRDFVAVRVAESALRTALERAGASVSLRLPRLWGKHLVTLNYQHPGIPMWMVNQFVHRGVGARNSWIGVVCTWSREGGL